MLIAFIMLTDDVWYYVRALCDYVIHGYYASKKSIILKAYKVFHLEFRDYNLKRFQKKKKRIKNITRY